MITFSIQKGKMPNSTKPFKPLIVNSLKNKTEEKKSEENPC